MQPHNSIKKDLPAERTYIEALKQLLQKGADPIAVMREASKTYIPGYSWVYARCIQDSLPDADWNADDTYSPAEQIELNATLRHLAAEGVKAIQGIVDDFEQGVTYHVEYRLAAMYSRLDKNKHLSTPRYTAIPASHYEEASQKIGAAIPSLPQKLTLDDGKIWKLERAEGEARIVNAGGRVVRDWQGLR